MNTESGSFSHLFDRQALAYAEYRPSYPPELYERIYKFCNFHDKPKLALDIATGSGQAAAELSRVFSKVVAIDSNVQQLKEARQALNIEYRKGLAEDTGMPDRSVDLVSVAQALHWFNLPKFFAEAARVLKPGGVFAAWGYGLCNLQDNQAATDLVQDFGHGDRKLGPYWSERRQLIDEEYASIVPDSRVFEEPVRTKVFGSSECTVDSFVGYISSWSSYSTYRQQHHDKEDPLIQFKQDLMALYGARDGNYKITVIWPIFLLMAKRKH